VNGASFGGPPFPPFGGAPFGGLWPGIPLESNAQPVKQNTPTIPSNMTGSSTANDTLIGSAPRFDGTADFWRSVRPDRSLMPTYFFEYFSVRN
jgi:hypothetical protein